MKKTLRALINNQLGMSLSTTIAAAFAGAVLLVFLVGAVVYLVRS